MANNKPKSFDLAVGVWMIIIGVVAGIALAVTFKLAPSLLDNPKVDMIWAGAAGAMLALGLYRFVVSFFQ